MLLGRKKCDHCPQVSRLIAFGWKKVKRDARFPRIYILCPGCYRRVKPIKRLTQWARNYLQNKFGQNELDRFYSEDISWEYAKSALSDLSVPVSEGDKRLAEKIFDVFFARRIMNSIGEDEEAEKVRAIGTEISSKKGKEYLSRIECLVQALSSRGRVCERDDMRRYWDGLTA